jgi:hypothetical protein
MRLAANERYFQCVTQSISLSNIHALAFPRRLSPEAHETSALMRACFWVAVTDSNNMIHVVF